MALSSENMSSTRRIWGGKRLVPATHQAVMFGLFLFVLVFSLAPLLRLLWEGLTVDGVLDFGRFARIFGNSAVWNATANTIYLSIGATALSALIGGVIAAIVSLTNIRAKTIFVFCFILPLMIPPQVAALAWINLFGPSSALLQMFGMAPPPGSRHPLYSMGGMMLVLGIINSPLVFIAFRASLRALPGDLVEAARAAGAKPLLVLRTIILPLGSSGLIAGSALAFVSVAGNFAIPAMLGIPGRVPTLITLIYQRISDYGQQALGDIAVLSLVLAFIAIGGLMFQSWLMRRRDVRVSNLSANPIVFALSARTRLLVELGCWLLITGILFIPFLALISTALVSGYGQALTWESISLGNFATALFQHTMIRGAFLTSFWISLSAAIILAAVTVPMAYFTVWHHNRLVPVQNAIAEIGYALPGTVVGISAILLFIKPIPLIGISLYGTPWIILAAYLMNRIMLALRPTISGFSQMDRALEEAAQVVGARFFRRIWDIVLPMIAPAAFAGGILVFLTALTEIQVSVLLVTSRTQTIGAAIYFLDESGSTTLASAVGVLIVFVVLLLMLFVSLFHRRLPKGALPWME